MTNPTAQLEAAFTKILITYGIQSDMAAQELAHVALASVEGEPAAFANRANLSSAAAERGRGGQGDTHTWSEVRTAYHDVPLYTGPQPAQADAFSDFEVLAITTAYEQGFGHAWRLELSNPYPEGSGTRKAWDYGRREGQVKHPQPTAQADADPLCDFSEGQWWTKELDAFAASEQATLDQKRAVAVVHNLLRAVKAEAAQGGRVPYAYAVYFPDQPAEELVHDLEELVEDLTNREHTITELFDHPATSPEPTAASQEQAAPLVLVEALRKLACLGNGDKPGNSDGNRIAQQALEAWASQEQAQHPKRSVAEWQEIAELEDHAGGVPAAGALTGQEQAQRPAQSEAIVQLGDALTSDECADLWGRYPELRQWIIDRRILPAQSEAATVGDAALPHIEQIVDDYLADYEMIGETEDGRDACHAPSEGEAFLIKDAFFGLLEDDAFKAWKARASLQSAQAVGEPCKTCGGAAVADLIARIDDEFAHITPLPWVNSADGRGVGLGAERWSGNGGFVDVTRESAGLHKHSGKPFAQFPNNRFIALLANGWPTIRAALANNQGDEA